METTFHRLRCLSVVLTWLTGAALLLGTEAIAAQQLSQTNPVEIGISSARAARLVSACRNEAERRAAPAKTLHSIQWGTNPEVMRSQNGTRTITRVSLAGRARSGDDWVPIKARCEFDKDRLAVVSLDLAPTSPPGVALNLSVVTTLPYVPAQPDPTLPSFFRSPPPTDPPEARGSSTIAPTLHETRPDLPPTTDKGQDFLHDHRFGIELRTPF
jgi:hypothetical protein